MPLRLSQRYADFGNELAVMTGYLSDSPGVPNDNATRLGVTADDLMAFATLTSAYASAYALYTDPETHTTTTVTAMRMEYETVLEYVLPLRRKIKNSGIELTAADYENLFIHIDKTTKTPHERPTTAPTLTLVRSMHLVLTFDAEEPTTEGVNRVALPPRTKVAREVAIVDQGIEPTEEHYRPLDSVGRGRFDVMFTESEVGKNGYLRCCYVSSRGEKGPTSTPLRAVII